MSYVIRHIRCSACVRVNTQGGQICRFPPTWSILEIFRGAKFSKNRWFSKSRGGKCPPCPPCYAGAVRGIFKKKKTLTLAPTESIMISLISATSMAINIQFDNIQTRFFNQNWCKLFLEPFIKPAILWILLICIKKLKFYVFSQLIMWKWWSFNLSPWHFRRENNWLYLVEGMQENFTRHRL